MNDRYLSPKIFFENILLMIRKMSQRQLRETTCTDIAFLRAQGFPANNTTA